MIPDPLGQLIVAALVLLAFVAGAWFTHAPGARPRPSLVTVRWRCLVCLRRLEARVGPREDCRALMLRPCAVCRLSMPAGAP